jgi:phosphoribosylamine--glycine ligase
MSHIAEPTIRAMAEEDTPFAGVLYIGLMMTARGPQVLEFNARFGDPETQAILPRLESDLVEVLEACIDGRLDEIEMRWSPGASACVVASSAGYPGSYKIGLLISGLAIAAGVPGVHIFHAGSAQLGTKLVTSGGRVLGVAAAGDTLEEALRRVYQSLAEIQFEGMYYRTDIGYRALRKKPA